MPGARQSEAGCDRLLSLGPENEPLWARLYIHEIGEGWAAMILGDDDLAPEPGQLKGVAFFGATPEGAERDALAYLGKLEPEN